MAKWCPWLLAVVIWCGAARGAHAAFTAAPSPLELGNVLVGSSSSATVSINDPDATGVVTATLSLATGGTCGEFSVPSASFNYGSAFTMKAVTLTPTSPGAKTCVVSVKNSGGTTLGTFTVNGTGQAPQITVVTAGPFTFGPIDVNKTTATQAITVKNDGNAQLKISSASFTGANPSSFVKVNEPSSLDVEAGNSVTWDVVCKPTAQGALTASFTIVSNSLTNKTVNIAVNCTGNLGKLALDNASLDFGAVIINGAMTRALKLSNPGNVAVTGIAATFTPNNKGYSIDPGTPVPATLAAGGSIDLTVRFDPKSATDGGAATLGFAGAWGTGNTTNTSATLASQVISLDVNKTPIDFGEFRFDKPVGVARNVANTGSASIGIDSITFVPESATTTSEIALAIKLGSTAATLPMTLNGGQILDVTVTPQVARIGAIKGKIVVHSTAATIPDQNIAITGNVTAAKVAAPALTDFGGVDIDGASPTQTIMISNTGDASLDISAFVVVGDDSAFSFKTAGSDGLPSAPIAIKKGTALPIEVTYVPTMVRQAGSYDAVVLKADLTGALGGVQHAMLAIQGRGIDRQLSLADSPTFPPTFRNPGDGAPVGAVAVRNAGEAPLKITSLAVTNPSVWGLVDASPFVIPGGGSRDIAVRFSPNRLGADDGELTLRTDDDANPIASIKLSGTGVMRKVALAGGDGAAGAIDLGIVGDTGRLEIADALAIANTEAAASFTIRAIEIDNPAFVALDARGAGLAMASRREVGIAFQPTAAGEARATARLYLDDDPEPQAEVALVAHAVGVDAYGGGCASAGDAGWCVALVGLLLVWRRRRAVACVCALSAGGQVARADDVRLGAFEPVPSTARTGVQVDDAAVGDAGDWSASSVASFATDALLIRVRDANASVQRPIAQRSMLVLGGAYGLLGRFEVGARMPLYMQRGDVGMGNSLRVRAASGTALGDVVVHGKARLGEAGPLRVGASLQLSVPTASSGQFAGEDLPTVRALLLATVAMSPRLSMSFNAGPLLRQTATYREAFSIEEGSGLAWGAGAALRATDDATLLAEVFGEQVAKGAGMTGSVSPVEGLVGASYAMSGFTISAAIGHGLSSALGAPAWRGTVALSFVSTQRRLPRLPRALPSEVVPAAMAPVDSDGDGVPDAKDHCPLEAEDRDGFEDADGCPELDDDRDGVADASDACPNEIRTIDGTYDAAGCPELGEVAPANPPDAKAIATADLAFKRGRALMAVNDYAGACAAFAASQAAAPAAGTRYNLAGCSAELGRLATAWTLYRSLARTDKNAERRAKAAAAAAQLAPRVPRLKLMAPDPPPHLQVAVNGHVVNGVLGLEVPIDLGRYTIVASAPGYVPWQMNVDVTQEAGVGAISIAMQRAPR